MPRAPNVVIIDDHPAEQALLRYFLSSKGIASVTLSPRAGIAALAALGPEVVLLDASSDGTARRLCSLVKERVPAARLVLLADETEGSLRDSGCEFEAAEAVLQKPLDFAALERVMCPILDMEAKRPRPARIPERGNVLVIDDDVDSLAVIQRVLGAAGCAVTCIADPTELLQRPPEQGFDLALIDLLMPDVDGLDVCFLLRQRYGDDLRICIITGAQDPDAVRRAQKVGADGWLRKPIRRSDLLALVGATKAADESKRQDPKPEVEDKGAAEAPAPRARRPHVLVVDDDRDVLEYCRAVFAGAGAVVDAIQDPSGLRDGLPPGGSYDLVLLDIFMPAMDGIELLKRFSADVRNCTSRLYIITAEDDAALRTLAHRSGADGFLTKPLRPQALLDLLAA